MNRAYLANVSWYRTGQAEEGWRNRDDDTYYAVGGFEKDSSLQGVVDTCVARRQSEWGREYHRVEVVITSACARCDGGGHDPACRCPSHPRPLNYRGKAKNCTLCKGTATDRHELSITL